MPNQTENSYIDPNWMAVQRGDKESAARYLDDLGFRLVIGGEISGQELRRLGWALIQFKGSPAAFLGYSRTGMSTTKTLEQLEIWKTVKKYKRHLKREGKPQVDAFDHVAKHLGLSESKVKSDYEGVQAFLIKEKKIRKNLLRGIAAL